MSRRRRKPRWLRFHNIVWSLSIHISYIHAHKRYIHQLFQARSSEWSMMMSRCSQKYGVYDAVFGLRIESRMPIFHATFMALTCWSGEGLRVIWMLWPVPIAEKCWSRFFFPIHTFLATVGLTSLPRIRGTCHQRSFYLSRYVAKLPRKSVIFIMKNNTRRVKV